MEKSKTIEAKKRKKSPNIRSTSKKESKQAIYTPKKNDLLLPNISTQNNSKFEYFFNYSSNI